MQTSESRLPRAMTDCFASVQVDEAGSALNRLKKAEIIAQRTLRKDHGSAISPKVSSVVRVDSDQISFRKFGIR